MYGDWQALRFLSTRKRFGRCEMLNKLGIRERATAKTFDIEPTSLGVRFFTKNEALGERIHIDLDAGDIDHVISVLRTRLNELTRGQGHE